MGRRGLTAEGEATATFMVECYWPEMTEDQVREVLERVAQTESGLAHPRVRQLGSLLVPSDGLVIFLFDGTSDAIQDAAKIAEVPFDRVVEFHHIPSQDSSDPLGFPYRTPDRS